jgi:hypothetical protein
LFERLADPGKNGVVRFGRRPVAFAVVAFLLSIGFAVVGGEVEAQVSVRTRANEVSRPVNGSAVMALPFAAGHLAVHWAGNPDAALSISTSTDAVTFGPAADVGRDEVGGQRGNGETYGAVLPGANATFVRVTTDRPIGRVTVLALADGDRVTTYRTLPGRPAGASVGQPSTLSRADWGADESLRFDATGKEVWPPTFWPVQKMIVHHTAGQNNDPDPKATIRSIYYYHAITQGWGDIGYNFVIDQAGHIYKGRHSHTTATPSSASPTPDDTITGESAFGEGVTAAHAYNFNSGTVGVALLGTFTNQDATSAAKRALEDLLAWKASIHGIDPNGSSVYTNPVNGGRRTFANIAGHRDVEATECPGGTFYDTLPDVRSQVAARIVASTSTTSTLLSTTTSAPSTTTVAPTTTTTVSATTTTTVRRGKKK